MNTTVLGVVPFIYLTAFIFYLLMLIADRPRLGRIGAWIALAGLAVHTDGMALRWIESYRLGFGHVPLTNLYESLVFFAWAMVLLCLILEYRRQARGLGAFILPVAFLCLAYASFAPNVQDRIQPLIPALKSNWLIVHVVTCFLGYAAFVIAAAFTILFLHEPRARERLALARQNTTIGFLLFTIGIMTGAVWAHYAWGSYWSWDPKETWALITWLVYAAALHERHENRIVVLTLVGLACVLFTYFGVNYLPGLHSYM